MQKIIGVTELQRRFRAIFDEVAQNHTPYVLTRGSRPEVVLIPYDQFLHFQKLQKQAVLSRFDQLVERMTQQNAAVSEAKIEAEVTAARNELDG